MVYGHVFNIAMAANTLPCVIPPTICAWDARLLQHEAAAFFWNIYKWWGTCMQAHSQAITCPLPLQEIAIGESDCRLSKPIPTVKPANFHVEEFHPLKLQAFTAQVFRTGIIIVNSLKVYVCQTSTVMAFWNCSFLCIKLYSQTSKQKKENTGVPQTAPNNDLLL